MKILPGFVELLILKGVAGGVIGFVIYEILD
jgi:hypothetical protein